MSNISYFLNLIHHFGLLISQLPDIKQNFFFTPDGAMNLTFKWIMSKQSKFFLAREILHTLLIYKCNIFWSHPLYQIFGVTLHIKLLYVFFYLILEPKFTKMVVGENVIVNMLLPRSTLISTSATTWVELSFIFPFSTHPTRPKK